MLRQTQPLGWALAMDLHMFARIGITFLLRLAVVYCCAVALLWAQNWCFPWRKMWQVGAYRYVEIGSSRGRAYRAEAHGPIAHGEADDRFNATDCAHKVPQWPWGFETVHMVCLCGVIGDGVPVEDQSSVATVSIAAWPAALVPGSLAWLVAWAARRRHDMRRDALRNSSSVTRPSCA